VDSGHPGFISSVNLRLTRETPPGAVDDILARLAARATYKLAFRFYGLENQDLAQSLLTRYCAVSPYSILDLALETAEPREARAWIELTGKLAPAPLPPFELPARYLRAPEVDISGQLTAVILCPWKAAPGMKSLSLPAYARRWALVEGTAREVGAAVQAVEYYRWADGILVRNRDMGNEEALFFLLYLYFMFGTPVNLHFENPLWESIYRTCLRREPLDPIALPENRLHYTDATGLRLIPKPPVMDRPALEKIYGGLISILAKALESRDGESPGNRVVNTQEKA
jgi:hypothetical protein